MTQPRVHGRYATQKQERDYRQKFDEIHGELRAEFKPLRVKNDAFPIASFLAGLAAISTLTVMVVL